MLENNHWLPIITCSVIASVTAIVSYYHCKRQKYEYSKCKSDTTSELISKSTSEYTIGPIFESTSKSIFQLTSASEFVFEPILNSMSTLARESIFGLTSELFEMKWCKLGRISEMYMYPIMSAKRKSMEQCEITAKGLIEMKQEEETPLLQDRMFIVYRYTKRKYPVHTSFLKPYTGLLITSVEYPRLHLVSVTVSGSKVILEAPKMSRYIFNKNYIKTLRRYSNCTISCCDKNILPLQCNDCGDRAAMWISKCLIGSRYGLRLALCKNEQNILEHLRTCITTYDGATRIQNFMHIDKLDNMLIVKQSLDNVNDEIAPLMGPFNFHPNIVISIEKTFFEEDEWECIKIGKVIIKNKIKQNIKKKIKVESNILLRHLLMGINCEVLLPGNVKIDEEVLVIYRSQTDSKS